MNNSNKFYPVVRERAVRLVQEHRGEYPSLWAAFESIALKICCVPQSLNEWFKREAVDMGVREGVTTAKARRAKELECGVKESRRANEILKRASAFLPEWTRAAESSSKGLHRPAPRHLQGRASLQVLADCHRRQSAPCLDKIKLLQIFKKHQTAMAFQVLSRNSSKLS